MAAAQVTGLVNAPEGWRGEDATNINPYSGLHRNVWVTPTALDLSGSNTVVYGPYFANNRVKLLKVFVTTVETLQTGQEAILQLGVVGDVDEFGTLDYQTDSPWDDGETANTTTEATSFLLENDTYLEAGEQLTLTLTGDSDGGTGTAVVSVEYIILDDV